jgi:hypothetical protein
LYCTTSERIQAVGCVARLALKCCRLCAGTSVSREDDLFLFMEVTGNMGSPDMGNPGRESQRRRSSDSKKLQSFPHHPSGVSSALWPADTRRSLTTGRVAQRQRPLGMNGKRRVLLATTLRTDTSLVPILISMFVGGIIVAALSLHLEFPLFIPITILSAMTLLIIPPLLLKLRRTSRPAALQPPPSRELRGSSLSQMRRRTPVTPLPAVPLVRVLETVDLSQSDAEHSFATATTEEP